MWTSPVSWETVTLMKRQQGVATPQSICDTQTQTTEDVEPTAELLQAKLDQARNLECPETLRGEKEVKPEAIEKLKSILKKPLPNLLTATVEELPVTQEVLEAVQTPPDLKKKYRRRRMSPKKIVQFNLKEVDHTICGPGCEEIPIAPEIQELNEEFKFLFPEKLPAGLPPERETDHRIDLKPESKTPAQRIYRLSPLEDKELQTQLKELQELGHIERAYSPYGAGVVFVPKANGNLKDVCGLPTT